MENTKKAEGVVITYANQITMMKEAAKKSYFG